MPRRLPTDAYAIAIRRHTTVMSRILISITLEDGMGFIVERYKTERSPSVSQHTINQAAPPFNATHQPALRAYIFYIDSVKSHIEHNGLQVWCWQLGPSPGPLLLPLHAMG
jgi:hypothetical protein